MNFNFADILRDTAQRHGERLALVDGDRRLTWSELDAAVDRAAQGFSAAGLVPGYRVVLLMANSVEFVTSYLGILRAGLVAVPLNTGLTKPEIGDRRARTPGPASRSPTATSRTRSRASGRSGPAS